MGKKIRVHPCQQRELYLAFSQSAASGRIERKRTGLPPVGKLFDGKNILLDSIMKVIDKLSFIFRTPLGAIRRKGHKQTSMLKIRKC